MAARFDVYIAHNSSDKEAIVEIAEAMTAQGVRPWLDSWFLRGGEDWQEALSAALYDSATCAVFVGPNGIGDWEALEYKLASIRMAADPEFRVFLVLLPGTPTPVELDTLPPFLLTRTWVDLRQYDSSPTSLQTLIQAVLGSTERHNQYDHGDVVCPFRGLQTFTELDAPFYFGRESDVQQICERLRSSRFLAVTGRSGSGKSSLVRAGVIPAIKSGTHDINGKFEVKVLSPGASPLAALAAALLTLSPTRSMQDTIINLAHDSRTLHLAIELYAAQESDDPKILIVVDQFEELFTLTHDDMERRAFASNILNAAFIPGGKCYVILTLRADFYQSCFDLQDLSTRLASHQYLVTPLTRKGLREVVLRPARKVGLVLEENLTEILLNDVGEEPGALPLLEHALLELWERRSANKLTRDAYYECGGVSTALANRADSLYLALSEVDRRIARRILTSMVHVQEGTEPTRKRVPVSSWPQLWQQTSSSTGFVEDFVRARLLTVDRDRSGESTIQLSHEALIRSWPRFQEWLASDYAYLTWREYFATCVRQWLENHNDRSFLLRGQAALAAKDWFKARTEDFSDIEKEYLRLSLGALSKARRFKAAAAALAITIAAGSVAAYIFARTDKYQILRARAEAEAILQYGDSDLLEKWARSMVVAGRSDEAIQAAMEVSDLGRRSFYLTPIAAALAELGFLDYAEKIVATTSGEREQSVIRGRVATAAARIGRPDEAKRLANDIRSPNDRVRVLARVVESCARACGSGLASSYAEDISRTVLKTEADADVKSMALRDISVALWELGSPIRSAEVLKYCRPNDAREARTRIALAASAQGDVASVSKMLPGGPDCDGPIPTEILVNLMQQGRDDTAFSYFTCVNEFNQAYALTAGATFWIKSGDRIGASRFLSTGLRVIGDASVPLGSIADGYAKLGQFEEATHYLRQAVRRLESPTSDSGGIFLSETIGQAPVMVDYLLKSGEASKLITHIATAEERDETWEVVIDRLIELGGCWQCEKMVGFIGNSVGRSEALVKLALSSHRGGDDFRARKLLMKATSLAAADKDAGQRSLQFSRIGMAFASLGDYRSARSAAARCSNADDGLRVYIEVLRSSALSEHPDREAVLRWTD